MVPQHLRRPAVLAGEGRRDGRRKTPKVSLGHVDDGQEKKNNARTNKLEATPNAMAPSPCVLLGSVQSCATALVLLMGSLLDSNSPTSSHLTLRLLRSPLHPRSNRCHRRSSLRRIRGSVMSFAIGGLVPFGPDANCTLDLCPLEWSILGYRPSTAASATAIALFALSLAAHAYQGARARTWGFTAGMVSGCILEIIGYAGRIHLYENPFDFGHFLLQISKSFSIFVSSSSSASSTPRRCPRLVFTASSLSSPRLRLRLVLVLPRLCPRLVLTDLLSYSPPLRPRLRFVLASSVLASSVLASSVLASSVLASSRPRILSSSPPLVLTSSLCITLAPVFFCAAIYILLSQLIHAIDESISRFDPKFIYWVFIPCDVVSLVLQAVGGSLSCVAETTDEIQVGVNISLAGLVFQVFTLALFCILFADYLTACWRHADARRKLTSRLVVFLALLFTAILLILLRCAYRIVELHEGYFSDMFRDEIFFIALESGVICVTVLVLNIGHPGLVLIHNSKQV
ncbi:hypothetical protein DCS_00013 [Drechmeria coniospora]|uniref:Parasitic phase-specific protein PSP-1 n=1 Tax=Drechmeria coniospora TaxID=98403 RepID=A0A151GP70_DRECN|nr:hypothetical protein DCS_00013 [Drechmeria coniospora]KYK58886.1 hypothetical protein DCS_00013 [Drechmeria coniospora]